MKLLFFRAEQLGLFGPATAEKPTRSKRAAVKQVAQVFPGAREVKRPGLRGAAYWLDEHGAVRYGSRPEPQPPTATEAAAAAEAERPVPPSAPSRPEPSSPAAIDQQLADLEAAMATPPAAAPAAPPAEEGRPWAPAINDVLAEMARQREAAGEPLSPDMLAELERQRQRTAAAGTPAAPPPPAEPPTPPPGGPGAPGEPPEPPRYDPSGGDVPGGYYAVPSRTGRNDLDFFKVDVGRKGGRYEGVRFVQRIIGGNPSRNVGRSEAADALVRIAHYGVNESAQRFGMEIGRCGRCGHELTDAVSRAMGIGPECRRIMGIPDMPRGAVVPQVDPDMPERPVPPPPVVAEEAKPEPPPPPPEPEKPQPIEKPGESAEDALRDEMRLRGIEVLDGEGKNPTTGSTFPIFSFVGNTYGHNPTFQRLKKPGPIWGRSLSDGRFAWHCRADRALEVLEAFNAERAARVGGIGLGEGSGGSGGLQPGPGEPGGAPGSGGGVEPGGVRGQVAPRDGGALHQADRARYQWKNLVGWSNEQLLAVQPPTPITPLDPALASILDPVQQENVRLMADAYARGDQGFLLGNQTGTGKTFDGCGILKQVNPDRALIIVPNMIIGKQWADIGKLFGLDVKLDLPTSATDRGIFLTTYNALLTREAPGRFGIMIADEVHQKAMKLSQKKRIAVLVKDLSDHAKMTVYSTATPYESPAHLLYLMKLGIWPARRGEWHEWAKGHGIVFMEKFIGRFKPPAIVPTWRGTRESKLNDMLRLRAEVVGPGKGVFRELKVDQPLTAKFQALPPNTGEYADTVHRAIEAIHDLSSGALRTNVTKRLLDYVKLDHTAELAAAKVRAGQHCVVMVSNKAPFLFEDPPEKEDEDSDEKIPSALREEMIGLFRRAGLRGSLPSPTDLMMEKIGKLLGDPKKVAVYTGDVSEPKRKKLKDAFNAGTLPVLVSTIAAGGTGLSLHDTVGNAPRTQINVGLPWTGRDFSQMVGRTYRARVMSPVEQIFLWTDAPRERAIAEVVGGRLAAMQAGVQGITAETNADKLAEFAIRGSDIEDDIDEQEGFHKSRRWDADLGMYEDEFDD